VRHWGVATTPTPHRPKRKRPTLSITVDANVRHRLFVMARKLPGGTVSGVVGEMLTLLLPVMEDVVQMLEDARRADGRLDVEQYRDRMAAYVGTTLIKMYDTQGVLEPREEDEG
jgi:hypothetical protein